MVFNENPPSRSQVVPCGRKDGQTDITKPIVAFHNFANALKKEQFPFSVGVRKHVQYQETFSTVSFQNFASNATTFPCHSASFNPLNPEFNSICYLLALLAHPFHHVSRIMVKSLTHRLLMSCPRWDLNPRSQQASGHRPLAC